LRYQLLPNISKEVIQNQQAIVEIENTVFLEWQNELIEKYKNNPKVIKNIDLIVNSFKTFLVKLFVRHGIESVSILYPNDEKSQIWLTSIQNNIIGDLPNLAGESNIVLEIEIPNFFKAANSKRKKYIDNLFNASFYWHLIQIDEKCTEYFNEISKGQYLILDNNIIFSLMGFHGGVCMESIHELLKFANELGYILMVSTKTIDEFYESLKRSGEKYINSPKYTKELADVAVRTLDPNNFMVTYWREFVEKRISLNEFIVEKSHLDRIFKELNISVIPDFRKEIEGSNELKDEESILRTACGDFPATIIEHDAFHNILVKRIRNGEKYKYTQAIAWFLTHDTKLPFYARASLKGKKSLPFCITTNEWIQINRPFIRRTKNQEEFEKSFTNLVTQPYLRTILASFKVNNVKEKILNNLSRYKSVGVQLAFEMVTDVQFLNISSHANNTELENAVESKAFELNQILQDENNELIKALEESNQEHDEQITELKDDINNLREKINSKATSIDSLRKELNKVRKETDLILEQRESLKQKTSIIDSEKEVLKKELERSQKRIITLKRKFTKWIIFAIILAILSLICWTDLIVIDNPNYILVKILINILLIFGLLNIPLNRFWKIWITISVACIIAIISILKK